MIFLISMGNKSFELNYFLMSFPPQDIRKQNKVSHGRISEDEFL